MRRIYKIIEVTGAHFELLFNNSLATVATVTEGNIFNQDGAFTFFNSGTINNAAGTVTNVNGSIYGSSTVSSQGSMATISMTAGSTTGVLALNLTNVLISDADSSAAPYTLTNATILIDTAPVLPPSVQALLMKKMHWHSRSSHLMQTATAWHIQPPTYQLVRA